MAYRWRELAVYRAGLRTNCNRCHGGLDRLRQLRAARAKLKSDVFEKRFATFHATWEQLGRLAQNKSYEYLELDLSFNKIHKASFLFRPDIVEYLNDIRKKAIEEQILWAKNPSAASGTCNRQQRPGTKR